MCGITGILHLRDEPVSPVILQGMTDAIAHRGPDGEGSWVGPGVGLGHRRLAIIDLSLQGRQPMVSADGQVVITYNGEVYNFEELRQELLGAGYAFRSRTDSEVVLAAYQAWGDRCVQRFNGMFAFAIWDQTARSLFLARDRFGIKPLYYWFRNGVFLFGSEIKALLRHPDVSVRVSIPALNEYFSFQNVFSDLTLFDGVRLLPPAHTLTLQMGGTGSLRPERYWHCEFRADPALSEEESAEELARRFEGAVGRQLVSDVEIGAYLSGGMDSGSITCVAARRFRNLKSFTCGFDLSSASGLELGFDERGKAEYLSNVYKTEHYQVVLKAGDMERVMPDLIWHLEDLRVGQSYPNYYVSRLAGKFVKVVLSGAGGDELFAGYPWRYYRAIANQDAEDYLDRYYRYWQRLIPDSLKPQFYRSEIYPEILAHPTREVFRSVLDDGRRPETATPDDYVNWSLAFEIRTFLHGLLVVEDKLSMAHGLEARVPFLDHEVVEWAMRVPVRHKLRDVLHAVRLNENEPGPKAQRYFARTNDGKIVLRRALARYLPADYSSGLKQGFAAPDGSWFKGESIEYIRSLLFDQRARIYDYMQPETTQALLGEHFSGKQNRRLLIWSLLCFEWWNRVFDPR
ncbi:MAG: asparagine synthase (glutamine-hydrolyzing) [bacterium]